MVLPVRAGTDWNARQFGALARTSPHIFLFSSSSSSPLPFNLFELTSFSLLQKLRAQPGDPGHHKLAVLAPSLAELETMPTMHDYRPAEKYFHKPRGDPGLYSSIKVVPREKPLVQNFDALEFLTRNMFVTRANLWHKALACVSPFLFPTPNLPLSPSACGS